MATARSRHDGSMPVPFNSRAQAAPVPAEARAPPPPAPDAGLLLDLARMLHPSDRTLLVRIIGRVVEVERTSGEAAALDMIETVIARLHGAEGRA